MHKLLLKYEAVLSAEVDRDVRTYKHSIMEYMLPIMEKNIIIEMWLKN